MAEEGLGGDEGHRDPVREPGLPDPVGDVEQELVGGTKARTALRRSDHDRAGIVEEALPRVLGPERVLEVADRLGGTGAIGPEARHTREIEMRAGGHEQTVVRERRSVGELDAPARRSILVTTPWTNSIPLSA